jgi:hypothetical protein
MKIHKLIYYAKKQKEFLFTDKSIFVNISFEMK